MEKVFGAIDIGASSGRVIAGTFVAGKISLNEVHRFPNGAVESGGILVWDFTKLMDEVRVGIANLSAHANGVGGSIVSLGIDTWAVDYGLVRDGQLLAQPNCYRDPLNQIGADDVHSRISFAEMYEIAGLQFLPFNSIYQLARQSKFNPEQLESATDIMLIPDLIGFLLTGKKATERTNASTTGMLDATTRSWSREIIERAGLTRASSKFPELKSAGETLGKVLPEFGDGLKNTNVVLVGSHDTASAVVGVPADSDEFAFISSGTWSLLGSEIPAPILSEASRRANFTNELGVQNRVRYLKNLSGLWLLAECLREWKLETDLNALGNLLIEAASFDPDSLLDLSDVNLISPGNMPYKINRQLERAGKNPLGKKHECVAVILHSLAKSYADNLGSLEILLLYLDAIHVVAAPPPGEARCHRRCGACVGPVEATAIGNLVVQMQAAGVVPMELSEARAIIANSTFKLTTYEPEGKKHG